MYICIYIYICIYATLYTNTSHTYICIHACMHAYIQTYTNHAISEQAFPYPRLDLTWVMVTTPAQQVISDKVAVGTAGVQAEGECLRLAIGLCLTHPPPREMT